MKKFNLKELLFIALLVATMFTLAYTLIPMMGLLPLPAYRALLVAPIYGGGVLLAVNKTKRFGTVTVMGALFGVMLSIFSVLMLFVTFVAGALTDVLCTYVLGGYGKPRNATIAAGLFPAIQIPLVFISMAYFMGGVYETLLTQPLLMILPTLATFLLGFGAAWAVNQLTIRRKLQGYVS